MSTPALAQPSAPQERAAAPIDIIRRNIENLGTEFRAALPQHIPVDRFKRVVLTAINQNPDLQAADRKSLFGACMRAAQDGLLPDGREGALVLFNTKVGGEWVKAVQWMPMVHGIIKKMRNSGELASISAHPVYERDAFEYVLGDAEAIVHKPFLSGDAGKMIAVYAIARLKDGSIQREVMTRAEVEKVRAASKSGNSGPWVGWFEEMARKTVVRRLSKYLPMSTEVEDALRADDATAAVESRSISRGSEILSIAARDESELDRARQLAYEPAVAEPIAQPDPEAIDTHTGEVTEQRQPEAQPEPQPAAVVGPDSPRTRTRGASRFGG